jgi:hypothetical protein
MTIHLLAFKDVILMPICLVVIFFIINHWANKYYSGTKIKQYIFPAFGVRVLGCILSALMYQYYYGTPDDANCYYETSLTIAKIIKQSPLEGLDILFSPIDNFTSNQWHLININSNLYPNTASVFDYDSLLNLNPAKVGFRYESNALICRVGGFLALFTYSSYLCIGLIVTFFSFLGCWRLFLVFYEIYPNLQKELAVSTLFIPSVCFWGAAGLMKETLVVGALGFFVYYTHQLFTKRRTPSVIFYLLLSFAILTITKLYIGMLLIASFLFWGFLHFYSSFKSTRLKVVVFLGLCLLGFGSIHVISKDNNKFNLHNIITYAFNFQVSARLKQAGSSYDLGVIEQNVIGIIKKIPESLNVALFRPHIWEVKKGLLLPSALESFIFLILSLGTVFRIIRFGKWSTFKKVMTPPLIFCGLFAFLLFIMVGFTSYNFGTLSRYRMPVLPFYGILLAVLSGMTREEGPIV